MENNKEQIHVINMANYTPVPITEKHVRGKDWVSYGDDNAYFQYVIDRYNGSTTNSTIVNGISDLIYGKGLDAKDASRKPGEYAQMISLFKKKDVKRISFDLAFKICNYVLSTL